MKNTKSKDNRGMGLLVIFTLFILALFIVFSGKIFTYIPDYVILPLVFLIQAFMLVPKFLKKVYQIQCLQGNIERYYTCKKAEERLKTLKKYNPTPIELYLFPLRSLFFGNNVLNDGKAKLVWKIFYIISLLLVLITGILYLAPLSEVILSVVGENYIFVVIDAIMYAFYISLFILAITVAYPYIVIYFEITILKAKSMSRVFHLKYKSEKEIDFLNVRYKLPYLSWLKLFISSVVLVVPIASMLVFYSLNIEADVLISLLTQESKQLK